MPDPLVQLHPDAAAERVIADGEWVRVSTPHGWFVARAKLTTAILPEVACAQYGWWRPGPDSAPDENTALNYNRAIDGEVFDPTSGSNALRASVCNVEACGASP
jgi:anaerobic selenocysteine-containing dehydrogenase